MPELQKEAKKLRKQDLAVVNTLRANGSILPELRNLNPKGVRFVHQGDFTAAVVILPDGTEHLGVTKRNADLDLYRRGLGETYALTRALSTATENGAPHDNRENERQRQLRRLEGARQRQERELKKIHRMMNLLSETPRPRKEAKKQVAAST